MCGDKCAQGPTLASPQVGKYEEAVADYTRAISLDPSNANAFHNRGSSFDKMGRLSEAVEDFTKAIELDPRNASSYNSRGLARDKLGARNEALADFTTAIGLDSKSAVFWHNRGYCLRNMYAPCVPVAYRGCLSHTCEFRCRGLYRGDYERAIENSTRAIELEPRHAAAFNNRGYAYRKLGIYEKAVEGVLAVGTPNLLRFSCVPDVGPDYTRSLELDPTNVRTLNNRGYSFAKSGDYDKAIADYTKVISLDPGNSHAYHNRGISFDKKGEFERAIADFTRVLELDSTNANAYLNRGSTHDSIGQHAKAAADYSRALDLDRRLRQGGAGGPVAAAAAAAAAAARAQASGTPEAPPSAKRGAGRP